ncbi:MAG TPA: hypothetical protein VFU21_10425 [Kofleriaceae bacterium]|nr:hypothetical protein [Kofleriaceae bacterium]
MSNSKNSSRPRKLGARIGKRALRSVSADELTKVGGGDGPQCVSSPPPPPCFTMDQDA